MEEITTSKTHIYGGSIILARKLQESAIWQKPSDWLKVWIFILFNVKHIDSPVLKRGQGFFNGKQLISAKQVGSDVTYFTWDHCVRWLKQAKQISTKKATRGVIISVHNYDLYQKLINYKSETEKGVIGESPAKQKRNRSEILLETGDQDKTNDTPNNDINDINVKVRDKSLTTSVAGRDTKKTKGLPNSEVDFVLQEFSRIFQLEKPADQKPRQWAYHISRKLSPPSRITELLKWIFSQEWGKQVDRLETIFRKIPRFQRDYIGQKPGYSQAGYKIL